MCWSLPTLIAVFFSGTRPFDGPIKRGTKKGFATMEAVWLGCWEIVETLAEALGDFILHHTKPTNPKRRSHQRNNRKQAGWRRGGTVITMTVLAMQANATIATERKTQFDTDSETIGIDNRCSGCISHVKDDFVGDLQRSDRVVKGFAGTKTRNV